MIWIRTKRGFPRRGPPPPTATVCRDGSAMDKGRDQRAACDPRNLKQGVGGWVGVAKYWRDDHVEPLRFGCFVRSIPGRILYAGGPNKLAAIA